MRIKVSGSVAVRISDSAKGVKAEGSEGQTGRMSRRVAGDGKRQGG